MTRSSIGRSPDLLSALAAAMVLWLGGLAANAQAPPPSGTAAFSRCDTLVTESPGSLWAWECYQREARAGRVPLPAVLARVGRVVADRPDNPFALLVQARFADNAGDTTAEASYRAAAERFAATGDAAHQVLALCELTSFYSRRQRVAEGEAALAKAREIGSPAGDRTLVARIDTADAWLAYRRSDYGRALRLLDGAREGVAGPGAEDARSLWLSARGAVTWALGRTEESRAAYREQAQVERARDNRFSEANALVNLTLLESDSEAKRVSALAALDAARASGNRGAESLGYFYLAEVAGQTREGLEYARAAYRTSLVSNGTEEVTAARRAVASHLLPFDAEAAFAEIDRAIADARAAGNENESLRSRFVKANMRWTAGPRDAAVADSQALLDAIESSRRLMPEAEVRARRFGQWRYAYYRLAGHVLAGHLTPGAAVTDADRALAFATLERMRARLLLDRLDAAAVDTASGMDVPERNERNRLLAEIGDVNRQLDGAADVSQRPALLARLEQLERVEREASLRLASRDPRYGVLFHPNLATPASVASALAPDEAMIAYQAASLHDAGQDYGAWAWVITREGTSVVRLPDPAPLWPLVDLLPSLVERGDGSEAGVSGRLHAAFVAPVLDHVPPRVSRLVVVPDERLHRVPFALLRPAPTSVALGTSYDITVAPSATVWLRLRDRQPAPASHAALIVSTPDHPAGSPGPNARRAARRGRVPAPATELTGTKVTPGAGALVAEALPYARTEAASVLTALPLGSRALVGQAASESAFKADVQAGYSVLHIVAHAVVDDERPEMTAILLDAGEGEDGRLQVREITELPLAGRIVILSSCSSASGSLVPGEGMLSLAHAFFQAGARTVVANLWPVRDREAAVLSSRMARELGRGATVGGAVATARRELIATGLPARAWSAVVVYGDGTAVVSPIADPSHARGVNRTGFLSVLALTFGAVAMLRGGQSSLRPSAGSDVKSRLR